MAKRKKSRAPAEKPAQDEAAGAVEVPQAEAEAEAQEQGPGARVAAAMAEGATATEAVARVAGVDAARVAPLAEALGEPSPSPALDPRDPGPYLAAIGLEPAHILASRVLDDGRLRVVTVGGRKLTLPDDEAKAKALTPGERDGVVRTAAHVNTHAINAGRK